MEEIYCQSISSQSLLQIVDKLPTIGTQLKIIASVKATTQGGDGQFDLCTVNMVYEH